MNPIKDALFEFTIISEISSLLIYTIYVPAVLENNLIKGLLSIVLQRKFNKGMMKCNLLHKNITHRDTVNMLLEVECKSVQFFGLNSITCILVLIA